MLTREKGWYKPVLVLAVCQLVPIAGPLVLLGYALEWARLSAWGIESAPKQRRVNIGGCFATGWRGFVVALVWQLAWMVALGVLGALLGFGGVVGATSASELVLSFLGLAYIGYGVFGLVLTIASLFFDVVVVAAMVRTAVYTKISAGLNPARVFEMVKRDASGLFKLVLIAIVSKVVIVGICHVVYLVVFALGLGNLVPFIVALDGASSYAAGSAGIDALLRFAGVVVPVVVIAGFAATVVSVATTLLETNAVGIWMSQFDVRSWGGPSDPLPVERAEQASQLPAPGEQGATSDGQNGW